MNTNNPLFEDLFEAWKFGPVLRSVRNEYKCDHMFESVDDTLAEDEKRLVASVFKRYDSFDAWDLSSFISCGSFLGVRQEKGLHRMRMERKN